MKVHSIEKGSEISSDIELGIKAQWLLLNLEGTQYLFFDGYCYTWFFGFNFHSLADVMARLGYGICETPRKLSKRRFHTAFQKLSVIQITDN